MREFRIYADESGTNSQDWLVIGMLFVPDHGPLHSALVKVKEDLQYFNRSPRSSARYKELHLSQFRSNRDVAVARSWMDLFVAHTCYFRCIVVDWSIWDGRYFGDPFESEALKKRRAYKKWAEMLLQPELTADGEQRIRNAVFYLDKLKVLHGYDVIAHLRIRFTENYRGSTPYIRDFQHTDSWKDANQCLQLCDLLTGGMYQSLVPAAKPEKQAVRQYLDEVLARLGVRENRPGFWRQYASNTLTRHFPKFSAWFWTPVDKKPTRKRRG